VEAYFADAAARHLAPTTVRKRRELIEGELLTFCRDKGLTLLKQLDVTTLRTFRNGWPYSALSAVKRLEYLRGFLRFCLDSGWTDTNPAMLLKPRTPVYCPLPPVVSAALEAVENDHADPTTVWFSQPVMRLSGTGGGDEGGGHTMDSSQSRPTETATKTISCTPNCRFLPNATSTAPKSNKARNKTKAARILGPTM
jgi:hypothetical protein